jgi:hypothetical protein
MMMADRCVATYTTVLLTFLTVSSAQAAVRFQDKFEDFSLEGFKHTGKGRSSVVNAPRAGNFAARLETDPGDRVRSELVIKDAKEVANGKDTWFGFSNRIDESWEFGKRGDIVFNVHKRREAGDAHGRQPLSLYVKNGRWELGVRGDANRKSTLKSTKSARFDLGPVEKGKWNDWVIRYKPSFNDDGEVEVWKDGQKVVSHKGANAFNDRRPGFAKFGIYRPRGGGTVGRRIIDFDEVKVGDESSRFEDVSPEGLSPLP